MALSTSHIFVADTSLAAKTFIDTFYAALNSQNLRTTLSSFYVPTPTPGSPIPPADISINGNVVATPADVEILFVSQVPHAHYEVQSYDCQVLNPNYNVGAAEHDIGPDASGRKMSLLLVVSGSVKYGESLKDARLRGFSESFLLVPNFAAAAAAAPANGGLRPKKWLIQSQNFRLVL